MIPSNRKEISQFMVLSVITSLRRGQEKQKSLKIVIRQLFTTYLLCEPKESPLISRIMSVYLFVCICGAVWVDIW